MENAKPSLIGDLFGQAMKKTPASKQAEKRLEKVAGEIKQYAVHTKDENKFTEEYLKHSKQLLTRLKEEFAAWKACNPPDFLVDQTWQNVQLYEKSLDDIEGIVYGQRRTGEGTAGEGSPSADAGTDDSNRTGKSATGRKSSHR